MIYKEKPEDFNPKFEVVSCFLEHDGKILLLRRQPWKPEGDTWGFPGGKVEDGESLNYAVCREVLEETGHKMDEEKLEHMHSVFVKYPEYDFVYHMYRAPLPEKFEVQLEEDAHNAYEWMTPIQACEKRLVKDMDACMELCFNI